MWDLTSFNETFVLFVLWDVSISPFVLINKSTQLNIRIKDVPLIVHLLPEKNTWDFANSHSCSFCTFQINVWTSPCVITILVLQFEWQDVSTLEQTKLITLDSISKTSRRVHKPASYPNMQCITFKYEHDMKLQAKPKILGLLDYTLQANFLPHMLTANGLFDPLCLFGLWLLLLLWRFALQCLQGVQKDLRDL